MKSLLRKFLKYFWFMHKPLVFRNKRFKDIHRGETCYILANGGSLKYYDISKLPKRDTITCSYALIDKRLNSMNVKYFVHTDSYTLYPFLFNHHPRAKKFQKNKILPIFNKIFNANKHLTTFINITNIYSVPFFRKNVFYYHKFHETQAPNDDLAGNFSNNRAALDIMLGISKYMGYKKAILIGCDYLGVPPLMGHFYADRKPFSMPDEDLSDYRSKVKLSSKGIDVLVILPEDMSSPEFNYSSYESYFNLKKEYQNNYDFIDEDYLHLLRDAEDFNQSHM